MLSGNLSCCLLTKCNKQFGSMPARVSSPGLSEKFIWDGNKKMKEEKKPGGAACGLGKWAIAWRASSSATELCQ